MTQRDIQNWLTYWKNANMVAVDRIVAFDQVVLARKFCPCMDRQFERVTDLQIWRALVAMREAAQARAA